MRKIFFFFIVCALGLPSCNSGGGGGVGPSAPAVWTHPSSLTDFFSGLGGGIDIPVAAYSDNGDAVIAWRQSDGGNNQVFMSELRNGTWTHPASLSDNISPDGQDVIQLEIAMSSNGDTVIAWRQSDGVNFQIFISEYRNGTWTHPSSLADNISPDTTDVSQPRVAMGANGDTLVVWTQVDGVNSQVFKSEYRNGTWTHPVSLADNISPDGEDAFRADVAMSSNGEAVIAWRQLDGVDFQVFISEYRNGTWTHPVSLADNISPDGQGTKVRPSVAMNSNGDTVIAWVQNDGTNDQIFKSEYRSGSWTHPSSLANNISPDPTNSEQPDAAIASNGDIVIAWRQPDGNGDNQVFMAEYREGFWTNPVSLPSNISADGANARLPVVAMTSTEAIITWSQDHTINPGSHIYMSRYTDGSWTHPSDIDDFISPFDLANLGDSESPSVAMNTGGLTLIVWPQDTPSGPALFKSEYR